MEKFIVENDLTVYCVRAKNFPEGVVEAHKKLHRYAPKNSERKYYGISFPDRNGTILYRAATTEIKKDELTKHNLEPFIIPKGVYHCIPILNYTENMPSIGKAFDKIIADPRIDPKGFCLEWYINDNDVWCMVRIVD